MVLALVKRLTKSSSRPLSALDELYNLVMERVHPSMLQTVLLVLVTMRIHDIKYARESIRLSGLSHAQWKNACGCLHSVMKVGAADWAQITFYHASFMDFVGDPVRSGRFCIWSDCAIVLLEEVIRHLNQMRVDFVTGGKELRRPRFPRTDMLLGRYSPRLGTWLESTAEDYSNHVMAFFTVLSSVPLSHNTRAAQLLIAFDFQKFCFHEAQIHVNQGKILRENVRNFNLLDTSLLTCNPS